MNCYICNSNHFTNRKGEVRDAPEIKVIQCEDCGLVTLSSIDHITDGFYEESGMHGAEPIPINAWLKDAEWDDRRRFDMTKSMIRNKKVLDFGCGAGGYLRLVQSLAKDVTGIELEARVHEYWRGEFNIVPNINAVEDHFDLITAFHVIEHLPDPRAMLANLAKLLQPGGRVIIEVPNAEDALLTLYDCTAFQNFTYWSQHLFLFNSATLELLARQAGLKVVLIKHHQRYPLSNHLYWLSKGRPGGHQYWTFLDNLEMSSAYASALAAIGKTDTLIAYLEIEN